MTPLSRVSTVASRTARSARNQFTRSPVSHPTRSSLSTQTVPAQNASTIGAKSRHYGVGNFMLGITLIGASAGTVYFTYLRIKNSGLGVAANTIMDDGLHPAAYPWPNNHPFATFDHSRYSNSSKII